MFFWERIVLRTELDTQTLHSKLESVTASTNLIRVRRLTEFFDEYTGKIFIGRIKDHRFKLLLLNETKGRRIIRRGQVVIIGSIEGSALCLQFRPSLFTLIFSFLWFVFTAGAFILSFYGPMSGTKIHWLLAGVALFAPAIVLILFRQELPIAKERLRTVLGV